MANYEKIYLALSETIAPRYDFDDKDVQNLILTLGPAVECAREIQRVPTVQWPDAHIVERTCLVLFDALCQAYKITTAEIDDNEDVKDTKDKIYDADPDDVFYFYDRSGNAAAEQDSTEKLASSIPEMEGKETLEEAAQKIFNCNWCGKSFFQGNVLKRHIEASHPGKRKKRDRRHDGGLDEERILDQYISDEDEEADEGKTDLSEKELISGMNSMNYYPALDQLSRQIYNKSMNQRQEHEPAYEDVSSRLTSDLSPPDNFGTEGAEKETETHHCKSCGKGFTTKSNLKQHKEVAHEGKRYPCFDCDKSFTQEGSLRTHAETVHQGIKAHDCNLCGAAFTQASALKRHNEAVHETDKDYRCNACGGSFSQAAKLKNHLRNHLKRETPAPTQPTK